MKFKGLLLIPTVIWILQACNHQVGVTKKKQVCISDSLAKTTTIDTAKLVYVKSGLQLSGEISFNENSVVKIFPFASGQVIDVKVSLGDKVVKGQTLAILKSADIAGDYADLASSAADMAIAKRQMNAAADLYKNGISSEREYTEAKEAYNKAVAVNNKIEQLIRINGSGSTNQSGIYEIKAPFSGYIVQRKINEGTFVRSDNSDSLFTISDMKDVWVWANVFETDIDKVKVGYTAEVTTVSYPDKVFQGKIDNISAVLDPDNKVMKIRISLPNLDMKLKPEMFAQVLITNREPNKVVSIPSVAIIFDSSKNFVIVYKDTCNLRVQEVKVEKSIEGQSYISSGLESGDRIVSKNQLFLYNALIED